jgi:hypothetical protein
LELGYYAAKQARENIINGGIEYVYLLRADADGARKVCKLLQMILLSPWLDDDTIVDFAKRDAKIKEKDIQSEIVDNLQTISQREGLKVIFLEKTPILRYCIHNASDASEAVLYLRHKGTYLKWEEGERVHDFWSQERAKLAVRFDPPAAIFFGAGGLNVRGDPFASTLKSGLRRYFPGIHEQIKNLCFDGTLG